MAKTAIAPPETADSGALSAVAPAQLSAVYAEVMRMARHQRREFIKGLPVEIARELVDMAEREVSGLLRSRKRHS
jgi:hypothetical protein